MYATTDTESDQSIVHKSGKSSGSVRVHRAIKSSVTTATTPNREGELVRIKRPDIISGGVPCQPASVAGKRRGRSDDRWLWGEAFEVVRLVHPTWCVFENVYGLLNLEGGMAFESLCVGLEGAGYEVQTFCIPACAVDAPHRRERLWIVGHTECTPSDIHTENGASRSPASQSGDVAHSADTGAEGMRRRENAAAIPVADAPQFAQRESHDEANTKSIGRKAWSVSCVRSRWLPEPGVRRVADGIPNRVHRLKALGNAVVPQIAEVIGRMILNADPCSAISS